jgi:hypothetical protein
MTAGYEDRVQAVAQPGAGTQPRRGGVAGAQVIESRLGFGGLGGNPLGVGDESTAGVGQGDGAGGAVEQRRAQLALQAAYLLAHGG